MKRRLRICLAATALIAVLALPASAAERRVLPGEALQPAIAAAGVGDVVSLASGIHRGPLVIDKRITLRGEPGAEIVGPGKGSTIVVEAPDVRIEGLTIRGSGIDLDAMDSGILVTRRGARAQIVGNRLEGNLFGVYLHGAAGSIVENNVIVGRDDLRISEAGNGVSIWNAPGAKVIGNEISGGRDGIFVKTSRDNLFKGNRFSGLRFAVHYMYTQDSEVVGNRSNGNHAGWVIMYSDRVAVRDNVSVGDRDHGLMLNSANSSEITGNIVRHGGEKCVFIYNANKNLISGNWFEGCPIGIHFTAGSERNKVTGNAFIGNRTQVKYVGTRFIEWSDNGRGNYWSDNPAFDLDGNGIADVAYRPNDVMDEILWTLPQAKLLLNSPAVETIRWAQSRFPALYPGGVVDSAPLMRPPVVQAEFQP